MSVNPNIHRVMQGIHLPEGTDLASTEKFLNTVNKAEIQKAEKIVDRIFSAYEETYPVRDPDEASFLKNLALNRVESLRGSYHNRNPDLKSARLAMMVLGVTPKTIPDEFRTDPALLVLRAKIMLDDLKNAVGEK